MNEIDKMKDLLKNKITTLKEKTNSKEQIYQLISNQIKTIFADYKQLSNLNIEIIKKIFPDLEELDYLYLEFYKNISQKENIKLKEWDEQNLNSILLKIDNLLLEKEEENIQNKNQLTSELNTYETILNKIKTEFDLEPEEIDIISELLKNSKIDINESIKIMIAIANKTLNEKEEQEENEYIIEETNLEYNDLVMLFKKHNSNFELFDKEEISKIQKYGDLSNIESIFVMLEKYKINSINEFVEEKSGQLTDLFVYSNSKVLEKTFETCIKNGMYKNHNVNDESPINFERFLERVSKIISRKKVWIKKNSERDVIGGETSDNERGAHEDFIKNIEFFASEGLDIESSYEKSETYFFKPHEHILIGIKNLKLYGIEKERYLKTLSCFASRKQADTIDLFIELGQYDYIKNNLSNTNLLPDSPAFYKMARARQLGIPIPKYDKKRLSSQITSNSKEFLGVNANNGEIITERFYPAFLRKSDYDEVTSRSDNNNIILSEKDPIIKELDEKYLKENEYPPIYEISGTIISRTKVLRFYNTLKMNSLDGTLGSLLYCVSKNSILTKEQYISIAKEIQKFYYDRTSYQGRGRQ